MQYAKKQLNKKEVLHKLASYCAYQDRCLQEVQLKLMQYELNQEEKDWIIEQLIIEKFLDEQRFAQTFCRSKFNHKKWGRNKIRFELKAKGIAESLISNGFKEIDEQAYEETLRELLKKKRKTIKDKEPFKVKKKLYAYAIGKGFEAELVHAIIAELS